MELVVYLLLILFVLAALLSYYGEDFGRCEGRNTNTCLSDINCEWNPYFDLCQNRTYNAGLSSYDYDRWYRPYYRYPWTRSRVYANSRPSWVYW